MEMSENWIIILAWEYSAIRIYSKSTLLNIKMFLNSKNLASVDY